MMNLFFKFILVLSSLIFLAIVFLITSEYRIPVTFFNYHILDYVIYILLPLLITSITIYMIKKLGKDSINHVESIEEVSYKYFFSYIALLGLLSLNLAIAGIIFLIVFILLFFLNTTYFNPLLLLFGYHYYNITLSSGKKLCS